MIEIEPQICRATAGDAPALSRLSAALFPLGCPANTKPEDLAEYINRELTPERFRAMVEDDSIVILIVKVANMPAGYALIAHADAPSHVHSSARLELRKFYIDVAYHGRGVADALMKEVLAVAADGSQAAIWLTVFSGNDRAISFYRRWGFQIAGTQIFTVGADGQKDYLMLHEGTSNAKGSS
jgi:ribosomal protein S18 acetylase RimI-like enzyme